MEVGIRVIRVSRGGRNDVRRGYRLLRRGDWGFIISGVQLRNFVGVGHGFNGRLGESEVLARRCAVAMVKRRAHGLGGV